jgi:hypothetical protein
VLLLALIARGRFHGASIMSLLFCAWFPWRLFHLDVVEVRHHHRVLPPASTGRVS